MLRELHEKHDHVGAHRPKVAQIGMPDLFEGRQLTVAYRRSGRMKYAIASFN
jgi:hypothetical protein